MNYKLKCCPFCGSDAEYDYIEWPRESHRVICKECKASTSLTNIKELAIQLWNHRIGYE